LSYIRPFRALKAGAGYLVIEGKVLLVLEAAERT
jgi:hypothetical protein